MSSLARLVNSHTLQPIDYPSPRAFSDDVTRTEGSVAQARLIDLAEVRYGYGRFEAHCTFASEDGRPFYMRFDRYPFGKEASPIDVSRGRTWNEIYGRHTIRAAARRELLPDKGTIPVSERTLLDYTHTGYGRPLAECAANVRDLIEREPSVFGRHVIPWDWLHRLIFGFSTHLREIIVPSQKQMDRRELDWMEAKTKVFRVVLPGQTDGYLVLLYHAYKGLERPEALVIMQHRFLPDGPPCQVSVRDTGRIMGFAKTARGGNLLRMKKKWDQTGGLAWLEGIGAEDKCIGQYAVARLIHELKRRRAEMRCL